MPLNDGRFEADDHRDTHDVVFACVLTLGRHIREVYRYGILLSIKPRSLMPI